MRILILSASTGGGHMKAAKAIKSYILKNSSESTVEIVDTLEYINHMLNKTVSDGYSYIAKKTPAIFGTIYNASNKENKFNDLIVNLNNLFSKKLLTLLNEFKPDAIIATHMFPNEMVSNLKGQGKISIPLICIITDYATHKTWISKNVDAYITANEEMSNSMIESGINKDIIYSYGIPVEPEFYIKNDKDKLLRKLNLNPNKPTILLMAGSFGVTNILEIYDNLSEINYDFQVVVITGKNERLYNTFKKRLHLEHESVTRKVHVKTIDFIKKSIKVHSEKLAGIKLYWHKEKKIKPTNLIFFTNKVFEYMQVADLIITKPGGLTVSEALACNLPMVLFNAIPGQEEENANFLVKNNMAIKIKNSSQIKTTVKDLISNENMLKSMRDSCKAFDKSQGNENILKLIKSLIEQ